jgi:hypothetical protein
MITFIAHLRVRPENAKAFEDLMTHVAAMTLENEPGVAYYDFAKSVEDADTYVESVPKSLLLTEGMPQLAQYVSPGAEPVVSRFEEMT